MDNFPRREVLKAMAATGAIGLPAARSLAPSAAHAMAAPAYNPAAKFDLTVSELEYRRTRRTDADGADLSAARAGPVPDRARPAWRRLERQGRLRRGPVRSRDCRGGLWWWRSI